MAEVLNIFISVHGLGPMRTSQMVKKLYKKDQPFTIVIGAVAKGSIDDSYCEQSVSFSQYPLSAATTCAKVLEAFEEEWNVL